MFKLLRHFSIASLLSIAAASLGLSVLHRQLAIDEMVRLGEAGNVEATHLLANAHHDSLRAFLALAPTLSNERLKADPETARLHETMRSAVKGTSVIKVKLYSLDGRTVYSSEARQIGEDKRANAGFLAARAGAVATELTRRDRFSAFEQQLVDRNVLSSYLPLRADAGAPPGAVFEVYQDITPFLANVDATQRKVVAGVLTILLALYAVLFLIVRRADRILAQQAQQGAADADALRAAGEELEQRVAQMRLLDARRERYLALSKLSSDWFWDQDSEFRFVDLDSKHEDFGGINRSVHFGKTRWELPHTEPVGTTWAQHRADLAAHRPFRNLLLRRSAPVGVSYISVSGEPVFGADGRFEGYRGVASDVTERVQAELSLAESREQLAQRAAEAEHAAFVQALLDALPVGVTLFDKNLDVLVANRASATLQGVPLAMVAPGAPLSAVLRCHAERGDYGPGDPATQVAGFLARVRDPSPSRIERPMVSGRTTEIRGTWLPDGSRCTTYVDITDHKRTESMLRESESRIRGQADFLQALLDALPVGISLVDKDLKIVATNLACRKLLDMSDAVFGTGVSLEKAFRHNAERGEYGPGDVQTQVAERMALARQCRAHRFERVRPDGSTIEIRGLPLPDGSMLTAYSDITDHKRAEIELVAARDAAEAGSQAKSNFLAVMSHEIRTPMNAVIGLLELLRLSPLDAEQRDTVDTVRESSKSLLRLIDDVLDFSKIEAGKLALQLEASSLAQLFDSAYQTFAGVASHKGVLLTQRLDARIAPALLMDRLRLRQIVNNLLSNAIKFTERGQVELTAELVERSEAGDRIRISVRDTGIGIDAQALARLFEPFSQADAGVERRYGGTGLGLAICKRLAELMGTTIEVQSAPGVGSRIGLTLTLGRAEQAEMHESRPLAIEAIARAVEGRSAPTAGAARAEGRLILVVDDHPVNRRMLARQLNVLGYAVQTAADGREALDHWRGGGFGLVFTDCQMPGMDGYQLASAIRQAEAGTPDRMPIIACTANVSREALDRCRAVGMNEALTKPVELAALKQVLDQWLPCATGDADAEPPVPLDTDFAAIAELAQGDTELQRDLLDDFRSANAGDLRAAARAVNDVAIDDLRRAAHRIKGAAHTVGAARLAEAATRLERAAHAGDWQRVSSAWAPLQQECQRLDERIATKTSR